MFFCRLLLNVLLKFVCIIPVLIFFISTIVGTQKFSLNYNKNLNLKYYKTRFFFIPGSMLKLFYDVGMPSGLDGRYTMFPTDTDFTLPLLKYPSNNNFFPSPFKIINITLRSPIGSSQSNICLRFSSMVPRIRNVPISRDLWES